MKKSSIFILAFTLIFAVSCKKDAKENTNETDTNTEAVSENNEAKEETSKITNKTEVKKIAVPLQSKSNSNVTGNIIFKQEKGVVSMIAVVSGLSEGEHAIHLHEKADCSSEDGTSTGGHWNPTFENHGKWGSETGFHRGDIGNFLADNIGHATIKFETDLWCIDCEDETKNIIGKAVIIHQGIDDYISQPSGAAGKRIVCGGIIY